MAPEALENKTGKFKNTKMLDIFALGMTMYFGLSGGGHPFSYVEATGVDDILSSLVSIMSAPFFISNKLSKDQLAANDLLTRMMERETYNRPKISEVMSHCLFWNWEKEQQFLIRFAICLSNQSCSRVKWLSGVIDEMYTYFYGEVHDGKSFNWITTEIGCGFSIPDLLFTNATRHRQRSTYEYGNGDSLTKFLKFFRDKYVYHPQMNPSGVVVFSENDGIFCEEMYVNILTSICPGLVSLLHKALSLHANEQCLLPLSKIYYPSKIKEFVEHDPVTDMNNACNNSVGINEGVKVTRNLLLEYEDFPAELIPQILHMAKITSDNAQVKE